MACANGSGLGFLPLFQYDTIRPCFAQMLSGSFDTLPLLIDFQGRVRWGLATIQKNYTSEEQHCNVTAS
jgi:hypothetical protein